MVVQTWVLERDVFPDQDDALAQAIITSGAEIVDWRDDWWLDGRWPRLEGAVMFHGSLSNADRVARELPWKPGAFCSTDQFACTAWWPQVPELLVSSRHVPSTVGELAAHGAPADFGERVFVRPDSALKPFSGRVLARDQITLAALDHGFYYEDIDLPVMVTPAIDIDSEWRFVAAGGRVVAGSSYAADGRTAGASLNSDHEAWQHATRILSQLTSPDPLFVLDICHTPDGLRLVELNPFSGADLYSCERQSVVREVHSIIAA